MPDTASPISPGALAAPLLDSWPEATPGATPAAPAAPAPAPSQDLRDSLKRPWNPALYKADAQGKPRKDSAGRWIAQNIGRAPGSKRAAPASQPAQAAAPAPAPGVVQDNAQAAAWPAEEPKPAAPAGPDRYDLAADVYCRAFYSMADGAFQGRGEWAPDDEAEHVSLRTAAAAWMRARGVEEPPPGVALALAVAAYGAKRIQRPNTATRWRLLVAWGKARFGAWITGRKIDALPAPVQDKPAQPGQQTRPPAPPPPPPPASQPAHLVAHKDAVSGAAALGAMDAFKEDAP
jgi:hypothetical protein